MLGTRIKELRKQKKISQQVLANAMGITQQAVGKWETGRSAPDPETVRRLADYFHTTTDDLLGHQTAPHMLARPLPAHRQVQEYSIPIIGTVRAGWDALAFEEDYGSEYANVRDPENYFYLIVKGSSMAPRIQDGDLALVHRQSTLESGDLGVVIYGEGDGTLKKFIRRGNTIVLQPFNPAYQPQVLTGEDLEHLHIAGKVVETKTKW